MFKIVLLTMRKWRKNFDEIWNQGMYIKLVKPTSFLSYRPAVIIGSHKTKINITISTARALPLKTGT